METPKPESVTTSLRDNHILSSSTLSEKPSVSLKCKENDYNLINQSAFDYNDELCSQSSLSSLFSKSLNRTESKSSLGILNVDQVSDYFPGFGTISDNDSIFSENPIKRKFEIEKHLHNALVRQSLGEASQSSENSKNILISNDSFLESFPDKDKEENAFSDFGKDSFGFNSFGIPEEEFQREINNSFEQELEEDEKLCQQKYGDSLRDHMIDGSLSGILTGDMSCGSADKLSMSAYLKNHCHSVSELGKNSELLKDVDEIIQPFTFEDRRKTTSDAAPSEAFSNQEDGLSSESIYDWSRIARGSILKNDFGVDMNSSCVSSVPSVAEIAKMFRTDADPRTPRAIVESLLTRVDSKRDKLDQDVENQAVSSTCSGSRVSSNHVLPKCKTTNRISVGSTSNSSLIVNELCSSINSSKSRNVSNTSCSNNISVERVSPTSCKSVPLSKVPTQENHPSSPSSPSRFSLDPRFLSFFLKDNKHLTSSPNVNILTPKNNANRGVISPIARKENVSKNNETSNSINSNSSNQTINFNRSNKTTDHENFSTSNCSKENSTLKPSSKSNSLADLKNQSPYQSSESIDMKLNNLEYLPFESTNVSCFHPSFSYNTDFSGFGVDSANADSEDEPMCRFWLSDSENLNRDQCDDSFTFSCTIGTLSDFNDKETSRTSILSTSVVTEVQANSSILYELDEIKPKLKLISEDGELHDENINAGIHCIGTPVEVSVPILNKSKFDIVWGVSHEVIAIDCHQINVNLAEIIMPKTTFCVPANRKSQIKLIIIPVVATAIEVKLNVQSLYKVKNGVHSAGHCSVTQVIRIIGEDPQLSIVSSSGVIFFGRLPNGCLKSENIVLQNNGHSRLPVKFSTKDGDKNELYQGNTIIEAGETWSNDIFIFASINLSTESPNESGFVPISGLLKINLNVDQNIIKEPQSLSVIQLAAYVFPVSLLYSSLCSPLVLCKPEKSNICAETLDLKNGSKIPLKIRAYVETDANIKTCFDVRPSEITIAPDQLVRLVVSFNVSRCTLQKVEADVYLQVEPKGIVFKSPVEVLLSRSYFPHSQSSLKLNMISNENAKTNSESRSISPTSSIASAVGQMQLACDETCLLWCSLPIHSVQIRSCLIKNYGAHREKLLFEIFDHSNCFKIVKSEKEAIYVSETKMLLHPSESKKLSVAFFPSVPQMQACGKVTITRCSQDLDASTDSNGIPLKRVIPLYGFCGTSCIKFNGLNKDLEDRLWMYPDSETFESTFTINNSGDASAFIKIVSEEFCNDFVKPNEYILTPHETTVINFAVDLSAFRIEKLLEKQKKDVVKVSKLLIYYGDESTRQRIKRLFSKCKKKKSKLSPEIEQKLLLLSNICPNNNSVSVDKLSDPVGKLNVLLDEIKVINIGVLMERGALESALLDTSPVFNDLNVTVREAAVSSPSVYIRVEPQSIALSPAKNPKFISVTNACTNDVSFHIVCPPELIVNPNQASLQAYQQTQLTVSYVGSRAVHSFNEQKTIKIISDKCEIKVIVEIKHEEGHIKEVSNSIYSNDYYITFPVTTVHHKSITKIRINNTSQEDILLILTECKKPFHIPSDKYLLKKQWYCNFRVHFCPLTAGDYHGSAKFNAFCDGKVIKELEYHFRAEATPEINLIP